MKKIIASIAILLALAGQAQAQVYIIEADGNPRVTADPNSLPFIPGHDVNWDQGYAPVGGGAALLIGFGAAYLLAKKRKK